MNDLPSIVTAEHDGPDDPTYVEGARHVECLARLTSYGGVATYLRAATPADCEENNHECWGCDGWLFHPPLTEEETARRRALWSADEQG